MGTKSIRVAIAGLGNCASSLIQGVEYYRNASPGTKVPGLMHVEFGDYHVGDIDFVAAFDVDGKKVGIDIAEATEPELVATYSDLDLEIAETADDAEDDA